MVVAFTGQKLRRLREHLGKSVEEYALDHRHTVWWQLRLEAGQSRPGTSTLKSFWLQWRTQFPDDPDNVQYPPCGPAHSSPPRRPDERTHDVRATESAGQTG